MIQRKELFSAASSFGRALIIFLCIHVLIGYDVFGRANQNQQGQILLNAGLNECVFEHQLSSQSRFEMSSVLRHFFDRNPLVRECAIYYLACLDAQLMASTFQDTNLEKLGLFTEAHRNILVEYCATISHGNLLPCKSSSIRQIAHWNPDEMLVWMTLKKRFLDQIVLTKQ